jgi:hypothetical protein
MFETKQEPDWVTEVRHTWAGFATLEALEHDRSVVAAGKVPARLTVAAAAVAAEAVRSADKEAGRKAKVKAGREVRARDLLEQALARECHALFEEAHKRGGLWSEAQGCGMANLDAVLLERMAGLGSTPAKLLELKLEAERMWAWGSANMAKRATLPLFAEEGEAAAELQWAPALTPEVLAPWVLRCELAPAVKPSAVVGEGDGLQVLVTPIPAAAAILHTPTALEVLNGPPHGREALLRAVMMGDPPTADLDPMFERAAAQAQTLVDAIGAAAAAAKVKHWVEQHGRGVARPVALAFALWRKVVRAQWDVGERRRMAHPTAAGPSATLQRFAAASRKPHLVNPADVEVMGKDGMAMPSQEMLAAVERGEIGAQSLISQLTISWLATECRARGGEGGTVLVMGGFEGLAREVLGRLPNPKQVAAIRDAIESWQKVRVRRDWGDFKVDGFVVGLTNVVAPDGRQVMLGITPGPVLTLHGVPRANALPPGQREAAKGVPLIPLEVKPRLVLPTRSQAGEAAIPDALVRMFYRERRTYGRGVLVTEAVMGEVMAEFGLDPAHAPTVLRELLTAEEEARERTTQWAVAQNGGPVVPLFVEVEPNRWQVNGVRWAAGHFWLLNALESSVDAVAKRERLKRVRK